jgi:tetratricopeptide (TPR) repeat protein
MRAPSRLNAGIMGLLVALSISLQPLVGKTTPWDTQMKDGQAALKSGDYGEARRSLLMALDSSKLFQTNDPRLAETYQSLGELYLGDQEYAQAKEYFNRALMVRQATPGADELKLADTLYGLATASEMLGDREMAVVLLKRVRDIWTKVNGSSSPKLIGVLRPLGIYATVNGDYKVAEDCYRQMISIQERTGGSDLGASLNLLASALTKQGKLDEASKAAERAVQLLGSRPDDSISMDSAKETLAYVAQEMAAKNQTEIAVAVPATEPKIVTRAPVASPAEIMVGKPPVIEQPKVETPKIETPKIETPKVETPKIETPKVEAPKVVETTVTAKIETKTQTKTVLPAPTTSTITTSSEFRPWELPKSAESAAIASASLPSANWGKIRFLAGGRLISKEEYQAMLLANEAYELIKTEKYKMACDILSKALTIAPNLASAHTNIGLALTQLGQTDQAIDHLKHAIAIDPDRSAAWINLASAFQLSGNLRSALVTYSEYVHRFPKDPMAVKAGEIAKHLDKEVKEQASIADSTGGTDYFAFASHEGAVRWPNEVVHLKVYIQPVANDPTYRAEYDGFAQDAFKQWAAASNDKVAFDFVKKAEGSDIDWVWTDDVNKVSSVAEGGETNVSYAGKKISHATVTVLTKNTGFDSPLSPNQIRAVSLHEIGHALGIIGHSPKPQDIMFCSMPPALSKPSLSARDVQTISKLYSTNISYTRKMSITL